MLFSEQLGLARKLEVTAFDLAQRYIGVRELGGQGDHPLISWWLSLCSLGFDAPDEIPWCSAFCQGPAWELRLPRSYSARARSWLNVGRPVPLEQARAGFDIVVLKRGRGPQPGPEVVKAPGHVGFYAGVEGKNVLILGGNQSDEVNVSPFPKSRVLGVRRLLG